MAGNDWLTLWGGESEKDRAMRLAMDHLNSIGVEYVRTARVRLAEDAVNRQYDVGNADTFREKVRDWMRAVVAAEWN